MIVKYYLTVTGRHCLYALNSRTEEENVSGPEDLPENAVVLPPGMTRRTLIGRGVAAGLTAGGMGALLSACGSDGPAAATARAGASFGGSGVADRAVVGAKALGGSPELTLVHPSGNAANFAPYFDEWQQLTGHRVKEFEIPIDQLVDKVFAGATAKTSDWDIVTIQPRLYGDLIGAGAIKDITPYVEQHRPDMDDPEHGFLRPQNGYATSYGGKVYGLDGDGDNWIYAYRSDLLEDAREQRAFEAKYGYPLAPATTWDEFRDIAEFFTRPDQQLYGAAELISTGWSFWWWELHYASKGAPNAYYFDDDMTPLIDSDQGVKALEELIALKPFMHKDTPSWNFTQTYALFAKGQAVQECTWSSLAKFLNTPANSKVVGKFGTARMPGTKVDGELISRSIFAFANSLMVWSHSKNPEPAYLFSQWITSPEMSAKMLAQPGFADPYRLTDLKDPTLKKIYTPAVIDAYAQTAADSAPEIMLKGSNEYSSALDRAVTSAFAGKQSAAEALKQAAGEWSKITDRLGPESQREAWLFLKRQYPQAA